MKKLAFLICFSFLLLSCNENSKREKSTEKKSEISKKSEEFIFSTWITYNPERTEESYREEFKKYKTHGISQVLINTLTDPEPLKKLVPIANSEGVKLHAWIMAVNRPNDKEALQHPDWYMVSREGKSCFDHRPYVDYYQWLCPTKKESREHILLLISKLAEVEGIESVHLDYIRFPDIFLPIGLLPNYNLVQEEELPQFDFCYCDACVAEFEKIHHKNPRNFKKPALDLEWRQFRLNKIRDLVNDAAEIVHQKGKKITAAVFPYPEMAGQMVRQRWDKWNIDRVYPMIYHNFYNEETDWVGFATGQGVSDLSGKATELMTGIYVPPLSADELKKAIIFAKENGAKGVSFYDGNALTPEQLNAIKDFAN